MRTLRAATRLAPLVLSAVALLAAPRAQADPIPLSQYDITDAVISGHGNWAHTYNGTITPGVAFSNGGFSGQTATYSGGSGTLTDGVIGGSIQSSQLFVVRQIPTAPSISPVITFDLPQAYTVDQIELYGGDLTGNTIPGAITGVTVTLLKADLTAVSETFATTAFGPTLNAAGVLVNDRISLIGSSLEGIGAIAITLSNFVGTTSNWISLTEVRADGAVVPEPNAFLLAAVGLVGLVGYGFRRRLSRA